MVAASGFSHSSNEGEDRQGIDLERNQSLDKALRRAADASTCTKKLVSRVTPSLTSCARPKSAFAKREEHGCRPDERAAEETCCTGSNCTAYSTFVFESVYISRRNFCDDSGTPALCGTKEIHLCSTLEKAHEKSEKKNPRVFRVMRWVTHHWDGWTHKMEYFR